jgi:Signal peptide peptidase.
MLFVIQIPRVDDYMGGGAMIGLGDLVLPGVIVAFAAR